MTKLFMVVLVALLALTAASQWEADCRVVPEPLHFSPPPPPWRPVFDEDGQWLVESGVDHAGHWEWQKAAMLFPALASKPQVICR